MNMFKKTGGFTLVELIVVIAILAILAGVAVPAYTGYIAKAQEASDYTLLDSVKTAVFFETIETDPGHDAAITKIEVTEGSTEVTVTGTKMGSDGTATSMTVNIVDYVSAIDFKSTATAAEWTSDSDEWKLK